jgi:hypothetical protein
LRKNDLIKQLETLPGNPEIKLWNGMVGDWMDIEGLIAGDLFKETEDHYLEMCRLEKCRDHLNFTYQLTEEETAKYKGWHKKNSSWQHNEFVTQEDLDSKRYTNKSIYYIDAKLRGEQFIDRQGSMSY